jgi:ABC-type nitrate/sulfonate/bicarbonate transport system substrate-binding protein
MYKVEPEYFYGTYFASQDWLTAHPDLAMRYLTALIQAHRFMYHNKTDTVRIAAQATGFSARVIDKTYEVVLLQNKAFPVNDGLEDQRLAYTITKMQSLGLLKGKEPALAQLVDRRPIMQALDTLGTVAQ